MYTYYDLKRYTHTLRLLTGTFLLLILFSGCGTTSQTPENTIDTVIQHSDANNTNTTTSISTETEIVETNTTNETSQNTNNTNLNTSTPSSDTTEGLGTFQQIVLTYPNSFPYTLEMNSHLNLITVNNMTAERAYDFSYATDSEGIKLLIANNNTHTTHVCSDFIHKGTNYQCTGTVLAESIVINASNFSDTSHTVMLNIIESASQPDLNEGTKENPKALDFNASFPYAGSVETGGESFYHVNNLKVGSRYQLNINNQTESVNMNLFEDLFVTDVKCDPNYSSNTKCTFVSHTDMLGLHIRSEYVFTGSQFDIDLIHISDADEFEGTWYAPTILKIDNNDTPHLSIVDNFNSYYHVTGLALERYYTVEFTSKTDDALLHFFKPETGTLIAQACNPDTRTNKTAGKDEECTFKATSSDLYVVAKGNNYRPEGTKFILKMTPGPLQEGNISTPVSLSYTATLLQHKSSISTESNYYHLTGLTAGNDYMVRLSDTLSGFMQLYLYDDPTFNTQVPCNLSNSYGNVNYCTLTSSTDELYIKVDGPTTAPGGEFTLTVSPLPKYERDKIIPLQNLPYSGEVDNFSSTYTITGLNTDSLYIAKLTDANGFLTLSAWSTASNTISCQFDTRDSGGCLLSSDSTGSINIRVSPYFTSDNNEPGGTFKIDIESAVNLSSQHTLSHDPIQVPDNFISGENSYIEVTNAEDNISNITVEVFLAHDYTPDIEIKLTSPSGQTIPLTIHANYYGGSYINTKFNDYANTNISYVSPYQNHNKLRYSTTFRPISPLHILNGTNANGTWTLNVADTIYRNRSDSFGGTLYKWGISFK